MSLYKPLQREFVPTIAVIHGERDGVHAYFTVTGYFRGKSELIFKIITQAPYKFHGIVNVRRAYPEELVLFDTVSWE